MPLFIALDSQRYNTHGATMPFNILTLASEKESLINNDPNPYPHPTLTQSVAHFHLPASTPLLTPLGLYSSGLHHFIFLLFLTLIFIFLQLCTFPRSDNHQRFLTDLLRLTGISPGIQWCVTKNSKVCCEASAGVSKMIRGCVAKGPRVCHK